MNIILFAAVIFKKDNTVQIDIPDLDCIVKGDSLTLAYSNAIIVSRALLTYKMDHNLIFEPNTSSDEVETLLSGPKDFVTCINIA